MTKNFRLATMSPLIQVLTLFLLALPVVFFMASFFSTEVLLVPASLLIVTYIWVWLRFRPSRFTVDDERICIVWPLKQQGIRRKDIVDIRIIDRRELKREIGWGLRVGAGGLWGGFGWLWTQRRGNVHMYISRTDRFVWIECANGQPWLITPEQPEVFVQTLSH